MKTLFFVLLAFHSFLSFSQNLPEFQAKNVAGKVVSRDSILSQNKITVINFWATWCSPCKLEMREINKLSSQLDFKDIQFISVSIDEAKDIEAAKTYFKTSKYPWKLYLDTNKELLNKVLAVTENTSTAIPISIVIDKNGQIVGYHTGFDVDTYRTELLHVIDRIKNK